MRVNSDVRLIVHRSAESLLLCYVDHHDEAYQWAEKRKLETHPKTGAAQLVELRETIQEILVPKYVEAKQSKPLLFAHIPDSELLAYGVPPAYWLLAYPSVAPASGCIPMPDRRCGSRDFSVRLLQTQVRPD